MWPKKVFNIFADITTHCNAGCPQCDRTNPNGLKKVDWLPLISWSLEDFKKAYRPSTLELTDTIDICGTWGDPIMNKEIYAICEYIMSIKSGLYKSPRIVINTNGSIRDEKWWWDLGVLCGDRLRVVFAIDGKNQEQHEKYRKFTNIDKILDNMKSISMTKAKVNTQTIVYKHNQDDLEEIKQLCLKHGSKHHIVVWTDRLSENNKKFHYTNPDGTKDYLEIPDKNPEDINLNRKITKIKDNEISCKWLNRRMIVVNPDGQVLPCCYIANGYYTFGEKHFDHSAMYNYSEYKKENNIFYKPLEKILADKWFNETLPESWKSDNPIRQCTKYCSKKGKSFDKLQRLIQ